MLGDESWSAYVRCDECGIKLETDRCGYETSEEAMKTIAKQWNTRATLGTDDGSRWHELFGTPKKTVLTLAKLGNKYPCDSNTVDDCEEECPLGNAPCRLNRDNPTESPLLEWLLGKAVKQ